MNTHLTMTRESESGFTLVELLVVIAIIAVLTAIAVPSFLSQRAKANDAAVRSDMKSVVTTIETLLIDNTGNINVTTATGTAAVTAGIASSSVKLSKGVTITSEAGSNATRYVLNGSHTGGTRTIQYDSGAGGFVSSAVAPSPSPTEEEVLNAEDENVRADMLLAASIIDEMFGRNDPSRSAFAGAGINANPATGAADLAFSNGSGGYPSEIVPVTFHVGVIITLSGNSTGYTIQGYHAGGSAYTSGKPLIYNSAAGGFAR